MGKSNKTTSAPAPAPKPAAPPPVNIPKVDPNVLTKSITSVTIKKR